MSVEYEGSLLFFIYNLKRLKDEKKVNFVLSLDGFSRSFTSKRDSVNN